LEINKIYNCDFLENTLLNESIDLIVTDPPYKVTSRGRGKNTNTGGMLKDKLTCQGKIFKYNDIKPQQYLPEFYRLLKEGSHCYIMTNHINLLEILTVAKESGFHFIKSLIWDKSNKIMSQLYMSQFEYILFFRKGKAKKINNCGTSDLIRVPNKKTKGDDGKNIHDTEKPVDLMKILIENSSQEGDIVLDPFIGVGATAIACKNSNRKYIGFEIDKNYYDIANKRLEIINNKVGELI